jgi:AraC family transcriptional regulator
MRCDVAYNRNKILAEVDALIAATPCIRLSEIARILGVDRHTIDNAMKARRKTTFREYRRRRLLLAVKEMLGQPHLSVKEIGIRLGYASAASFSRFVRETSGKSPRQLRSSVDAEGR